MQRAGASYHSGKSCQTVWDMMRITYTRGIRVAVHAAQRVGRMTSVLGSAAAKAAAHIINLAKPLAAKLLDCDTSALVFSDGLFLVSDTNRSLAIEPRTYSAKPGHMHVKLLQSHETDGATTHTVAILLRLKLTR